MKKALLIVAAGLAGLVGLTFLLVWLIFDPNDYRADAEAAFERATGRALHITGEVAVSFFPWLGLQVGTADISNRAGFGETPFASLRGARIGVRLVPLLLHRRVEVGRVTVEGLQLDLQVDEAGADNWSDMLDHLSADADREPEPPSGGTREPMTFSIASLQLIDSRLSFDDRQAGSHYAIEHWDFETGRLERGHPADFATKLRVARNHRPVGRFDLKARLDLTTPGTARVEQVAGRMQLAGIGPSADGLPVEIRTPLIAMTTATRALRIDDLEGRLPGLVVATSLQVTQAANGPTVQGPLVIREGDPRRLLESLGITPPHTRDRTALDKLKGTAQLTYSRNALTLGTVDLQLDDAHWQGEVSLPDLARRSVRFDLSADRCNVDRYRAPPAARSATPPPPVPPETQRRQRATLQALDVQGSLEIATLIVGGVTLQDVQASVAARDGVLRADPVQARAFGGRSTSRLQLDVRGVRPTARLDENFSGVDVGQMLGQLIGVRQLEGRGRASFTLDMSGATARELFANTRGNFDLTVENGQLIGADLWHEIEKGVAAAQGKVLPPGGTGRTPFDRLAGRGTLQNRTLHNEQLEFASSFIRVKGGGDVDFGRNRLDLALRAHLLKLPPGRVLGLKVSRIEGAKIPVAVKGKIDQPKVEPDVTALLGAVAKSVVTEPLGGSVKRKLKQWIPR